MVKNKTKGTTLDDLVNMVAKGFEGVDKRFDKVEDELGDVRQRLGRVEKKVDKLDYQMDEVYDILKHFEENDILNLQKRVQVLEKVVQSLATQIQK